LFVISRATPAAAQPYTTLLPRSASDWVVVEQTPGVTWSVTVNKEPKGSANPRWEFHADSQEGIIGPSLTLWLNLSDFGVAPPTPEEAEYWAWHWFVRNMKTADMVNLSLIDEYGRGVGMATSHALYDYDRDYFAPPSKLKEDHNTLTEMLSFRGESWGELDPPLGRIVAVGLTMEMPHQQEVWLGPISFSRVRATPVSPSPRARREIKSPGRALFVDLDGDGRVEAVAPWLDGAKIWRFDPRSGQFRVDERRDALATCGPLSQVAAADLDGDGDLDLVGVGSDQTVFYTFTNRSGGFTATNRTLALPSRAAMVTSLALADDDGDGRVELFIGYHLVSQRLTNTGRIFRCPGLGGGRFGDRKDLPTTFSPSHVGTYYVALVDLDADGVLDLVSAAGILGVHVFRGLGGGRYGEALHILHFFQNGFFRDIVFEDVDGNGFLDLYVAMQSVHGSEIRTGQNYLLLNDGDLHFRDVSLSCGVTGGDSSSDVCLAELNGRPGPELVVLEVDRLDVFDFARWRDAGAIMDRSVPRTELLTDPDIVSGAERMHLTDLDGDGVVEAVLSRETGFDVVPLPGTGPVRTVRLSGLGDAQGVGGRLSGQGWSAAVLSNSRTAPGPWLVAADERVSFTAASAAVSLHPELRAGAVENITLRPPATGPASFAWLRWRAPRLWERPYFILRSRTAQIGLGSGAIMLLGVLLIRARRGARRRTEEASWLVLLRALGVTSHAKWREAFTNFGRILRHLSASPAAAGSESIESLRALLPREILATLREGVSAAADLNLEGGRAAARSVRVIESLHGDSAPDWAALRGAVGTLDSALSLIQRALAQRFSSDAHVVFGGVRAFHEKRPSAASAVEFRAEDELIARVFPLRADHLFICLDELLTNAAKKDPRPGRIVVSVGRDGQHRAFLGVVDDGDPLAIETARDGRAGSRSGLRRIEELLAPYAGSIRLTDLPAGGVSARISVPRFDLDA
jgi:signal transduction histidine kinase